MMEAEASYMEFQGRCRPYLVFKHGSSILMASLVLSLAYSPPQPHQLPVPVNVIYLGIYILLFWAEPFTNWLTVCNNTNDNAKSHKNNLM